MTLEQEFNRRQDPTALARAVALRIVRYRTDLGLTQVQLASRTGMTQPAIARLESGRHKPTIKTLEQVTTGTTLKFTVRVAAGASYLEEPER